jgi:hypothetical protein
MWNKDPSVMEFFPIPSTALDAKFILEMIKKTFRLLRKNRISKKETRWRCAGRIKNLHLFMTLERYEKCERENY